MEAPAQLFRLLRHAGGHVALLLLLAGIILPGCSNKDEAYKKSVRPLFESLTKIRDDIHGGKVSPTFSADCDAATALLDKARHDLNGEDEARASFVHMQDALEGYVALRSIASRAPSASIANAAQAAKLLAPFMVPSPVSPGGAYTTNTEPPSTR